MAVPVPELVELVELDPEPLDPDDPEELDFVRVKFTVLDMPPHVSDGSVADVVLELYPDLDAFILTVF